MYILMTHYLCTFMVNISYGHFMCALNVDIRRQHCVCVLVFWPWLGYELFGGTANRKG